MYLNLYTQKNSVKYKKQSKIKLTHINQQLNNTYFKFVNQAHSYKA